MDNSETGAGSKSLLRSLREAWNPYLFIAFLLYLLFALNGGVGIYDWQKELAYFQYIKASLTEFGMLPWFWWDKLPNVAWYPAVSHTSNFVANPETMLFSPFTPLLFFMQVLPYIKLLSLVHCAIGILGVVALGKRLGWDARQSRIFSILFLFSPITIQHLSIGYTPWLNLFFFPWLVYFMADERARSGISGTSAVLALVLLQGGTHVFIWFAGLLTIHSFYLAFSRRVSKPLFRLVATLSLVVLLSFVRIFATTMAYADFIQPLRPGYNPVNFAFWALVPPVLAPPVDMLFLRGVWFGVPSWDGGVFWGASLVLLLFLGLNYRMFRCEAGRDRGHRSFLDSLMFASTTLLFLSFFSILEQAQWVVNAIVRFPFSEGVEKYPFRLAIPAYLGFSVVVSDHFGKPGVRMVDFLRRFFGPARFCRKMILPAASISLGAFTLSFIFEYEIRSFLGILAGSLSHGTAPAWMLALLKTTSHKSPDQYYQLMDAGLSMWRIVAFVVFALLVVLAWSNRKRTIPVQETVEVALALPLLFASIMWLSVSVSVPYAKYPVQKMLPPVVVQGGGAVAPVSYSPKSLTIHPCGSVNSGTVRYDFPGILASDARHLSVTSGNGAIDGSERRLSVVVSGSSPVTIEFVTRGFSGAFFATFLGWLAVLPFLMLFPCKRGLSKK